MTRYLNEAEQRLYRESLAKGTAHAPRPKPSPPRRGGAGVPLAGEAAPGVVGGGGDPGRPASALEREVEAQLVAAGLPPWVREFRFWPGRRFRLDFAWPALRVALEVEGGVWTGGRHTRGAGFERDALKYSEAAIRGWLVVRVTTGMVKSGAALELVKRAIEVRA